MNIGSFLHRTALIIPSILILAVSCQDKVVVDNNGISLKTEEAEYKDANQWLRVKAPAEWTLQVTSEDGESAVDWVTLSKESGTGIANVLVSWSMNSGDYPRTCRFEMTSGDKVYQCFFTQKARTSNQTVSVENFRSDAVANWLELPSVDMTSTRYFVTHDMVQASGKKVRNYSFLFDVDAHVALWVAYPLNKSLIGSGSRHFTGTSYWVGTIDPKVPREYQAITESPYSGYSGLNRGHQIPSADRLSTDANFQTFYGTNMTPQNGRFNSYAWASLEGMVRTWANSFDTLYVVTGADIRGVKSYANDNAGKKIAIPVGYFKALLGYKRSGSIGMTATTGGYTGIGFYFENKDYGELSSASIMSDHSMTLDALENKMGYDFFANLPSKTAKADIVESTRDSWWK